MPAPANSAPAPCGSGVSYRPTVASRTQMRSGTGKRTTSMAFSDPDYFDGVYALLRSERPVVLHFAEDNGSVWLIELLAMEEPVGEVDRSFPVPDFGFKDLLEDLEATARDSG